MAERPAAPACGRRFPEEHLSGYLDRALTQGEAQRVRIHLENCAVCRDEVAGDDQWDETPRTSGSRWALRAGWTLAIVWGVAVTLFALWQLAVSPEELAFKLVVFGGLAAAVLLFVSILLDRLRVLPGDRYRRVQR
jgi:hypothetical protein